MKKNNSGPGTDFVQEIIDVYARLSPEEKDTLEMLTSLLTTAPDEATAVSEAFINNLTERRPRSTSRLLRELDKTLEYLCRAILAGDSPQTERQSPQGGLAGRGKRFRQFSEPG